MLGPGDIERAAHPRRFSFLRAGFAYLSVRLRFEQRARDPGGAIRRPSTAAAVGRTPARGLLFAHLGL